MNEKGFTVRFIAIEIVEKSMENLIDKGISTTTPVTFKFNFLVDIKLDQKLKIAMVNSVVTILSVSNEKLALLKTMCVFEFPEFESVFKKNNKDVFEMPLQVEIILKSEALSTTRGMMYSELRGTYLNGAILPLFNIGDQIRAAHKKNIEQSIPPAEPFE